MALIKEYALKTGLTAPNAYHVVVKVDTVKRVHDDPDPGNLRPINCPDYIWKSGYYGLIAIAIYASKESRESGCEPIAMKAVYPTGVPYAFYGLIETDQQLNFTMDINSSLNDIEQAYQHLKTLEYYKDAIED